MLRGFAVFESASQPSVFVAQERLWNLHPRNVWVDMTPRTLAHAEMLLVEADVDAAQTRARALTPPAATP